MFRLTVEEARAARICRVCARPIHHPPGGPEMEECLEHRLDSSIVDRNGREFAHAACLAPGYGGAHAIVA